MRAAGAPLGAVNAATLLATCAAVVVVAAVAAAVVGAVVRVRRRAEAHLEEMVSPTEAQTSGGPWSGDS